MHNLAQTCLTDTAAKSLENKMKYVSISILFPILIPPTRIAITQTNMQATGRQGRLYSLIDTLSSGEHDRALI